MADGWTPEMPFDNPQRLQVANDISSREQTVSYSIDCSKAFIEVRVSIQPIWMSIWHQLLKIITYHDELNRVLAQLLVDLNSGFRSKLPSNVLWLENAAIHHLMLSTMTSILVKEDASHTPLDPLDPTLIRRSVLCTFTSRSPQTYYQY